jgi:hypothetical protein
MIGWSVKNELERIWKEVVGMNRSWGTGYSDGVFMVILSLDRDMPGWAITVSFKIQTHQ